MYEKNYTLVARSKEDFQAFWINKNLHKSKILHRVVYDIFSARAIESETHRN